MSEQPKASLRTVIRDYGNHYIISPEYLGEETKEIKSGVYTVTIEPNGTSLRLSRLHSRFKTPVKVYGNVLKEVDIISKDFINGNHKSMGVLLTGKSGGGKTTEGNILCNRLMDTFENLIVFYITVKVSQELLLELTKFGRCVFYFNEFDKYYKRADQEELLPFFSDFDLRQAMCIVTANDESELSPFILDRPERFKWRLTFQSLNENNVFNYFGPDIRLSPFVTTAIREWASKKGPSVDNALTLKSTIEELGGSSVRYKDIYDRVELLNIPKLLVPVVFIKELRYELPENGIKEDNFDIVLNSNEADEFEFRFIEHSSQREFGFYPFNVYDLLERKLTIHSSETSEQANSGLDFNLYGSSAVKLTALTVYPDRFVMTLEITDALDNKKYIFTMDGKITVTKDKTISEVKTSSDWEEARKERMAMFKKRERD